MAAYVVDAEHLRSPETAKHRPARIGPWVERYHRASEGAAGPAAHIVAGNAQSPATGTINCRGTLSVKRVAWERSHAAAKIGARILKRLPEHNAGDVPDRVDQVAALPHASEATRAAIDRSHRLPRRGRYRTSRRRWTGAILLCARNTRRHRTRVAHRVPALRPWAEAPAYRVVRWVKSVIQASASEAAGATACPLRPATAAPPHPAEPGRRWTWARCARTLHHQDDRALCPRSRPAARKALEEAPGRTGGFAPV